MLNLSLVLALAGTPDFPKLEARNLGISASLPTLNASIAAPINATHYAFWVSEAQEGGADLNSDGDLGDDIVHLLDLRTGSIANLGFGASDAFGLGMADEFLVYRSITEPPGIYRLDLTSGKTRRLSEKHTTIHLDQNGWVILRTAATFAPFPVFRPDGRLADTLRLGSVITGFQDGLAALIPWEGNYRDFNGDHDTTDEVAMFYDVRSGRLVNSGLAVNHKQSDISADYPPRVTANWIWLLVSEWAQGAADLNGNGTFPSENSSEHVPVAYSRATGEVYQLNDASNISADMGRYLVYAASSVDGWPGPVRVVDSQQGSIIDLGVTVDFTTQMIVQGSDDGCLLMTDEGPQVLHSSDLSLEPIPEITVLPDFVLGATPVPGRTALIGTISEASGDLNGDGDTEDRIIYRYDYATESGGAIPIASSGNRKPSNGVWPFVSDESEQSTDWNEDGDTEDRIWILVDETTGAAYNTGLDVGQFPLGSGTYGFLAYSNGTALFRGHENVSGIDWNDDGDTEDSVLFEAVLPAR